MNKVTKVLLKSFITNISLSIVKIVSGLLGASGALIADGIHSLSDTATDVFAIFGHKLSMKPADREHPFGHGRMEYITCIVIGFIVLAMGCSVIYSGIFDERTVPSIYVALISVLVILVKIILSKYLLRKAKVYQSNILMASGKESFSDVISSLVVLVSILISQLSSYYQIFEYSDMVAMIIVGILILRIAYNILKENLSGLLGAQVTDALYLTDIKNIISGEKDVKGIDALFVLKYGPYYHIDCEVSMKEDIILKDAHAVLDRIEDKLRRFDKKITKIIIHINPYKD